MDPHKFLYILHTALYVRYVGRGNRTRIPQHMDSKLVAYFKSPYALDYCVFCNVFGEGFFMMTFFGTMGALLLAGASPLMITSSSLLGRAIPFA